MFKLRLIAAGLLVTVFVTDTASGQLFRRRWERRPWL